MTAPVGAIAADDYKISQLEQDVRDLQRRVQAQSQEIEELRMQLNRPTTQPVRPASSSARVTGAAVWADASKWQMVKPGMSELEVIGVLGPPVSMRDQDGDRVLLYAMEIGTSGFLSGSVTLHDRMVLKVQKPELR